MCFVSYKDNQYFCKVETFIAILAIVLGLVGIVGSIAPGLPGPPLSWVGLLIIYLWGGGTDGGGDPMTLRFLLIWLAVTIIVTIVDYIVPAYFTKLTGGSHQAQDDGKYGDKGFHFAKVLIIFVGNKTPIRYVC